MKILILLLPLLLLAACGGSMLDDAKMTIDITSEALVAADTIVASRYDDAAQRNADLPAAEYEDEMGPLDTLVDALQTSMSSMLAVRVGLAAWEQTEDSAPFYRQLACWGRTLAALRDAASAAGIDIPIPGEAVALLGASTVLCPDRLLEHPPSDSGSERAAGAG